MAGVQAKRQGLSVIVFEKSEPGGAALAANLVENFPGQEKAITGRMLMARFTRQAARHKVAIKKESVLQIGKRGSCYTVRTNKSEVRAKAVIIATGASPRALNVPGEKKLIGKNIFSYVDPNTVNCRNKHIIIVGDGDAAFDQAINFAKFTLRIVILMKHNNPKAAPFLVSRAKNLDIDILPGRRVESVSRDLKKAVLHLNNHSSISADIVVTCIGKEKNFDFMDSRLLKNTQKNLFFAGDCLRGNDRHIAIACGDGIAAAMAAAKYISEGHLSQ